MPFATKTLRLLTVVAFAAIALIGLTMPAHAGYDFFKVVGGTKSKCVDIRLQDGTYGARAQLYDCHGKSNQRFTLMKVGYTPWNSPMYKLVSQRAPGLCLGVRGSSQADGAQVDQESCSADQNLYWYWDSPNAGHGGTPLVNLNSRKCLDVEGSSTGNGERIQQRNCNRTASQAWRIES